MRDTIRWSYDLLDSAERRLFERLSVFAGGWSLEAAQAVEEVDEAPECSVLEGLASLVDKSLVFPSELLSGEARFDMLEPVREFGLEELNARPDAADAHARHARYFTSLAEPTATRLEGDQPGEWLDRLDREHDNFRAALQWASTAGEPELGYQLIVALWEYWNVRGYLSESRRWLALVLRTTSAGHPRVLRRCAERENWREGKVRRMSRRDYWRRAWRCTGG